LYQLDFVTDATNADEKFTRNFFRNKVLPLIESVYPAAAKNLINNTERFTDVALLYQQAIDLHKKSNRAERTHFSNSGSEIEKGYCA
jgi:tRNA(Ile)-lysidine synthase